MREICYYYSSPKTAYKIWLNRPINLLLTEQLLIMRAYKYMKFSCFCLVFLCTISTTAQKKINKDIDKSVKKSIQFLSGEQSDMEYSVYAVYHYLERLYKIQPISSDTFFIEKIALIDSNSFSRLEPFFCLTRTSMPNTSYLNRYEKNALDYYMVQTLACNVLKLEDDFLDKIETLSDVSNYELTHSYLILQWLKEGNCANVDTQKLNKLQVSLKRKLLTLLRSKNNNWDDVYLEALAFLCYTDGKKYIRTRWLNAIIQHQMPNGGWKHFAQNSDSSAHPTVFALWVMLAYQQKTALSVKWIYPNTNNPQK